MNYLVPQKWIGFLRNLNPMNQIGIFHFPAATWTRSLKPNILGTCFIDLGTEKSIGQKIHRGCLAAIFGERARIESGTGAVGPHVPVEKSSGGHFNFSGGY